MTNKMIKILSLALMFLGCIHAYAENITHNGVLDNCPISAAIGLIDKNADTDEEITRKDLAKVVYGVINCQIISDKNEILPFLDINPDEKEIISLAKLGIISGYDDGTFKPENKVSPDEALAALVNATGHKSYATANGGYPMGYRLVASQLGITDGVDISENRVKYSQLIKLAENTLMADYADTFDYIITGNAGVNTSKTMLNYYFDIYETKGVVTSQGKAALTGEKTTLDGYLSINGIVFEAQNVIKNTDVAVKLDDYVGYPVKAYYKEEADGELCLIHIQIDSSINTKTLYASQLNPNSSDYTVHSIVGYDVSGKQKVYKLDSPDVFYNGVNYYDYTVDSIKPSMGKVILIDNDKDGLFEVVKVYEYENFVVKSVNQSDYMIYDYYGKSLTVDPEKHGIIMDLSGNVYNLKDLKVHDVLSVFKSRDGNILSIRLIRNSVKGKITQISNENFILDGESSSYILSDEYKQLDHNNKIDVRIGLSGAFLLDVEGRVCAIMQSDVGSLYGYLVSVNSNDDEDYFVTLKIFTSESKFIRYNTSKKINVNGVLINAKDIFNEQTLIDSVKNKAKPQLIKYSLNNDGVINKINYYDPTYDADDSLKLSGSLSSGYYTKNASMFQSEYVVSDECLVFLVPNGSLDEDCFQIGSKAYFADGGSYANLSFYDCNDANEAKVMVFANYNGVTGNAANGFIVSQIKTEFDAEENMVFDVLEGYLAGKKVSYAVTDKNLVSDISVGSVVRLNIDQNNRVKQIVKYFDVNTADEPYVKMVVRGNESHPYWSSDRMCCAGYVGGVSEKTFTMLVPTDNINAALKSRPVTVTANTKIYMCDLTNRTDPIRIADYSELMPETTKGAFDGDFVYVYRNKDVANDILIIRGF